MHEIHQKSKPTLLIPVLDDSIGLMSVSCDRVVNKDEKSSSNEFGKSQWESYTNSLDTSSSDRNALILKGKQLLALYQTLRREGHLTHSKHKNAKEDPIDEGIIDGLGRNLPSLDLQRGDTNLMELNANLQNIWNVISFLKCPQIESALHKLESVIEEYNEPLSVVNNAFKEVDRTSEMKNASKYATGSKLDVDQEKNIAIDGTYCEPLTQRVEAVTALYDSQSECAEDLDSMKEKHNGSETSGMNEKNEDPNGQEGYTQEDNWPTNESEGRHGQHENADEKQKHSMQLSVNKERNENSYNHDTIQSTELRDSHTLSLDDKSHLAQDPNAVPEMQVKENVSLAVFHSENPVHPDLINSVPCSPTQKASRKNDASIYNVTFVDRGPIGIHFQANFPDSGATVRELLPHMAAEKIGQVEPFDRLIAVNKNSVETAPFRHVMLLLEGGLRPLTLTFARPTSDDAILASKSHEIPANDSIWQTTKHSQEHHLDEEIVLDAESEEETELNTRQNNVSEFDSNISIADKIITNVFSFFWKPPTRVQASVARII